MVDGWALQEVLADEPQTRVCISVVISVICISLSLIIGLSCHSNAIFMQNIVKNLKIIHQEKQNSKTGKSVDCFIDCLKLRIQKAAFFSGFHLCNQPLGQPPGDNPKSVSSDNLEVTPIVT